MPLSEQEQRLLDEMERNLYRGDADYVATVGERPARPGFALIVIGVIAGLAGIALLLVGVSVRQPVVGVVGFLLMFGGALIAIAPPRRLADRVAARSARGADAAFLRDVESERWQRQQGDDR